MTTVSERETEQERERESSIQVKDLSQPRLDPCLQSTDSLINSVSPVSLSPSLAISFFLSLFAFLATLPLVLVLDAIALPLVATLPFLSLFLPVPCPCAAPSPSLLSCDGNFSIVHLSPSLHLSLSFKLIHVSSYAFNIRQALLVGVTHIFLILQASLSVSPFNSPYLTTRVPFRFLFPLSSLRLRVSPSLTTTLTCYNR